MNKMRIADRLRLKAPGHKSVDTVVEIVQRSDLTNVELRLESRVKYLRGEPFRENMLTVYFIFDGRKAKMHTAIYAEDLKSPGQDDQAALSAENVVQEIVGIGQQFLNEGITPTITGYENDFGGFVADFQHAQHAPISEFYGFLAKFCYQIV